MYPDTNTLFPISIADLLLRLGDAGVIEILWSDYLLAEVERVLTERKSLTRTQAGYFCGCIRDSFPNGRIAADEYAELIATRTGPDPDDHPHSAAASAARADVLVSADKNGYPARDIAPAVRMSADEFLTALFKRNRNLREGIIRNVEQMATSRRAPVPVSNIFDALDRAGAVNLATQLRRFGDNADETNAAN